MWPRCHDRDSFHSLFTADIITKALSTIKMYYVFLVFKIDSYHKHIENAYIHYIALTALMWKYGEYYELIHVHTLRSIICYMYMIHSLPSH